MPCTPTVGEPHTLRAQGLHKPTCESAPLRPITRNAPPTPRPANPPHVPRVVARDLHGSKSPVAKGLEVFLPWATLRATALPVHPNSRERLLHAAPPQPVLPPADLMRKPLNLWPKIGPTSAEIGHARPIPRQGGRLLQPPPPRGPASVGSRPPSSRPCLRPSPRAGRRRWVALTGRATASTEPQSGRSWPKLVQSWASSAPSCPKSARTWSALDNGFFLAGAQI